MNKPIKVIISDLDGTLLNAEHTISDYSKKVVRQLAEHDIRFIIATGRHLRDASKIKEKLGVNAYLITSNGATVADEAGNLIYQASIPSEVVKDILSIEVEEGVYKNLYQGDHWLMEENDKVFDEYYQEGDFAFTLCRFEDRYGHPTNKIFFTTKDYRKLEEVAKIVSEKHGDIVDLTFSMPECLEIMPKGVNKGAAILETLNLLGVSKDHVIAFGDGMNDVEMLQVVGKGYLMGNATPKLVESLPKHEMIGKNSEDGVARHIEKLLDHTVKTPHKAVV